MTWTAWTVDDTGKLEICGQGYEPDTINSLREQWTVALSRAWMIIVDDPDLIILASRYGSRIWIYGRS